MDRLSVSLKISNLLIRININELFCVEKIRKFGKLSDEPINNLSDSFTNFETINL
jgi:hypothetical protein